MKEFMYRSTSLKALSVLLVVSFLSVICYVSPAEATIKHFLLGGLAGAAIILAAPAIMGALGVAGGAVAGATVAAGGVLVGAATAVGGFFAGAAGLIGAGVLAAVASPLFLPVVCFGAGLLVGKLLWDRSHGKSWSFPNPFKAIAGLFGGNKQPTVTDKQRGDGVTKQKFVDQVKDAEEDAAKTPDEVKITEERKDIITEVDNQEAMKVGRPPSKTEETESVNLSGVKAKYEAAYRKYVQLLQAGKGADDADVKAALAEYKKWYLEYQSGLAKAK